MADRPRSMTVAVTGASGNLGQAVASAFIEGGATVIVAGRSLKGLSAFPDRPGIVKIAADLADETAALDAFAGAVRETGGVDALCAVAGGFEMGEAVHELSAASLARMLDMNVFAMLGAVKAVAPSMIERGRGAIVTVGAGSARHGGARMGAYAASKSALMRLTESMAAELGPKGVRVNCILPTTIDTPQNRAAMPQADFSGWAKPEEIAAVVRFLCSEEAAAIHGAMIPVCAGAGRPRR